MKNCRGAAHCTAEGMDMVAARERDPGPADEKCDAERCMTRTYVQPVAHGASRLLTPCPTWGYVLRRGIVFHALRHTFITRPARSGVAPAVAKSLARHSGLSLTMDHYTHTFIEDERSAPARLPGPGASGTRKTVCGLREPSTHCPAVRPTKHTIVPPGRSSRLVRRRRWAEVSRVADCFPQKPSHDRRRSPTAAITPTPHGAAGCRPTR
jgi:hypothetical protein